MDTSYWQIQQSGKPLFPDLIWSKPEGRSAGKLLIIGGHGGSFHAPAEAYNEAIKAGIGVVRVILPMSLKKSLGKSIKEAEFAPSNPSGSFGQKALEICLENADWSDGIMLAGDLGRSSETAILLEKFVTKTQAPLILTNDSLEFFYSSAEPILYRPFTTLVLTMGQLQKLCKNIKFTSVITSTINIMQLVKIMHELTLKYATNIVIVFQENIIVAASGQVSSTRLMEQSESLLATRSAVWLIQNPTNSFGALTTAVV